MVSGVKTYCAFHISKYVVQFFLHRGVLVCIAKIRASGQTFPPSTCSVHSFVVLILCMVGSVVYSISVFSITEESEHWPLLGFHSHLRTVLYWKMKFGMLGPYQLPGGNRWPPQFECVSGTRKIAFGCLSWYYLYREYGGKFRSPGKLRFWKLFSLSDEPGFGRRKTILFSPLGRQLWVTICLRL